MGQERLKTLLVFNEAKERLIFETALSQRGHEVRTCCGADEALEVCRQGACDLIIFGRLLGIEGLDSCRRIRELPWGEDVVILVTVGHDRFEILSDFLEAGADDFMAKPFSPAHLNVLLMAVENRCKRRREARQSRKRIRILEQALESTQVGVTVTDPDGVIQFTNQAEAQMHGFEAEELLGRKAHSLAPAELTSPLNLDELQRLGRRRRESTNIRKDGSTFPVRLLSDLVMDPRGEPVAVITTCEDITEWKEAEAEKERIGNFLTGILNSLSDPLYVIDVETYKVVLANPAAGPVPDSDEVCCYTLIHGKSEPCSDTDYTCPLEEVMRSGQSVIVEHAHHIDGVERDVEIHVHPLRDAEGRITHVVELTIDVTDRKLAEERLQESEEKYRGLFDEVPCGVFETTQDGEILSANQALAQMLGFSKPEEMMRAYRVQDLYGDPDERNGWVERLFRQDRLVNGELTLRTKDGREVVMLENARLRRNDGQEQVTFQGTLTDITDLKRTEQELRKFKTVADTACYGIGIVDLGGNLTYLNDEFARMHGYTPDELDGKSLSVFHSEEQMEHVNELNAKLIRNGSYTAEEVWRTRRDGSVFPTLMTGTVVKDEQGEPIFLSATAIDITEQNKTMEALQRANEIINRSPAVSFVWKTAEGWPVEYVSENVERLFGWTREDFVSDAIPFSSVIHPEDLERVVQEVAQSSADPKARVVSYRPYRIVTRDGEVKWVEDMTVIRRGDDGKVVVCEGILLDITDRIQAEQALQRAHDELETRVSERTAALTELKNFSEGILNNMTEGVFLTDSEGLLSFVNPAVASMLGYQSPEELQGCPWQKFVPSDQIAIAEEGEDRRARGVSDSYDLELLHTDGSRVPCQLSSSPRFQERQAGSLIVLTDLTERKQAEQILQEREKSQRALYTMLRLMADNVPDMLWAKDLEGRYLFANLALCTNLLGAQDADEPIGKNDMFFATRQRAIHSDDPHWHDFGEMCGNSDGIVLQSRKPQRFDEYGNVQGKFLFLDVFKAPMWDEDGRLIGTVGCARDVTREKEVQRLHQEAAAERLLLGTAIEQVAEGVMITAIDGTIQYVNPAFERITGYSREAAIGSNPSILKSGKHDDEFYRDLWETVLAGRPWIGHVVNKRADGRIYDEATAIYPVRNQAGELVNFIDLKRDVTKEMVLQKESQQARKMEALGQLAGSVAHDFNNLVAVIQGSVDLLRDSANLGLRDQHLDVIARSCRNSADLTRSLLGFTRQQVMTSGDLDLNELVTETLPMLNHLLPDNIQVQFSPAVDLGNVNADRTHINQVLLNLCSNSRDAMPGGGTIVLETGNIMIDASYRETHPWAIEGPHVFLSVADTGVGMDEETLSRVFEPFFTTKDSGGTGLGLASAYGTVKQQGGMIDISSDLGKGTTVVIYLPEVEARGELPAEEHVEKKQTGGHETVLIVEDHADLRMVMEGLLKSLGHRVLVAMDGMEALEILQDQAEEVALVITDVTMPRMGGDELWRQSRELAPDMRYLFCSGNLSEWKELECSDKRYVQFLQKPFEIDTLADTVRELLERE